MALDRDLLLDYLYQLDMYSREELDGCSTERLSELVEAYKEDNGG